MKQALADGADYVGFGPMFPTQSKKDADEVVTPEAKEYALKFDLPVVTIGGISLANIRSLYDEGFRSFAMISAIVGQKDIKGAVEKSAGPCVSYKRIELIAPVAVRRPPSADGRPQWLP